MKKKAERVDCRCRGTYVDTEVKGTVYRHRCECRASQDPDAAACWNCLHGAHRRIVL